MKKNKILILTLALLVIPGYFIFANNVEAAPAKTVSVKNTSDGLIEYYEKTLVQLENTERIIQIVITKLANSGVNTSILQSNITSAKIKTSEAKTVLANIKIAYSASGTSQTKSQVQSMNTLIKDSYTYIKAATNIIKDIFKNKQTKTTSSARL